MVYQEGAPTDSMPIYSLVGSSTSSKLKSQSKIDDKKEQEEHSINDEGTTKEEGKQKMFMSVYSKCGVKNNGVSLINKPKAIINDSVSDNKSYQSSVLSFTSQSPQGIIGKPKSAMQGGVIGVPTKVSQVSIVAQTLSPKGKGIIGKSSEVLTSDQKALLNGLGEIQKSYIVFV